MNAVSHEYYLQKDHRFTKNVSLDEIANYVGYSKYYTSTVFHKKYGMTSFLVRMEDKINRVKTLSEKEAQVKEESIKDTLLDLANYALLAIIELESEE